MNLQVNLMNVAVRRLMTRAMDNEHFYYKTLAQNDGNDIIKFLQKNFRLDEPLNRSINITEAEIEKCFTAVVEKCVQHPISILARSREDDSIVGCMLNSVWKKPQSLTPTSEDEGFAFGKERYEVEALGAMLNELHGEFWKKCPQFDTVIHFEVASVSKQFQRRGIASNFMKFTENPDLLKSVDASAIVAEASSLANQVLLRRRGYETVSETLLNNIKNPKTGEQIFKCDDGTDRVILMMKKF